MKNSLIRILLVFLLAASSFIAAYRLPTFQALDFFAIQLSMLGSMFIAYAINDGRMIRSVSEFIVAMCLLLCTLLGMWKWPWLIPLGYVSVGLWSILHRTQFVGVMVRSWFANLCAIYAWLLAGFILLTYF